MTRNTQEPTLSRRRLLARLGLAAGLAYVAPTMLELTPAHASGASRGSRPSRASRPSRPSRPGNRARVSRPGNRYGISRPRGRSSREDRALDYLFDTLGRR